MACRGCRLAMVVASFTGLSSAFTASARGLVEAHKAIPPAAQEFSCKGSLCFTKTQLPETGKSVRARIPLSAAETQVAAFGIAALSSFFNGSFPACQRIPRGPPLDPVLFNCLVCVGVFFSSLLIPLVFNQDVVFTLPGVLGGVLFVFAALFSFVAIPRAGLATAQAVWSCSAILVSFLWGAIGPAEVAAPLGDVTATVGAVLLLVAGALIIVNCDSIAGRLSGGTTGSDYIQAEAEAEASAGDRTAGIASALAVGLFGGSVLVPFKYIPPDVAGLAAIPSFGFGALIAGVMVTFAYWKGIQKEPGFPQLSLDQIGAGLASGLLWNAGNVCSVIAQSPPFSLPYGVAYPILQCALFFGGLWGIYVFKEITGNSIGVFWGGALTLVAGVVLLGLYGPGAG
ncbi:unnamed protein product [Cladocopium goreaui]|uniref:Uncharacterized protein n=1 Tax=Cladocopium goreaui TaxID=2562237 RepID=A0A9P1G8G5_9DINO|nr:unnamed protein product [Cladocopium goreaui]